MGWINSWEVTGTSGKAYTVSSNGAGTWGCTCPAWKFQKLSFEERKPCQHILRKQVEQMQEQHAMAATSPAGGTKVKPVTEASGRKFREDD